MVLVANHLLKSIDVEIKYQGYLNCKHKSVELSRGQMYASKVHQRLIKYTLTYKKNKKILL